MANYRFIKDSSLERPKNVSKETYASASYGDVFYYSPQDIPLRVYGFYGSITGSDGYKILRSLKNTINYYQANDNLYNFENFYNKPVTLLAFNSPHLGSGIKKGSINLGVYSSGSIIDSCSDRRETGVLYNNNDEKVGIILYNEGFILLNNTSSLTSEQHMFNNGTESITDYLKWIYFSADTDETIFFDMEYLTKNEVSTNTYFVVAEKNELNHSNNQTYLESGSYSAELGPFSGSDYYYFRESEDIKVKKTNKSPFISGSAEFDKQTFITNIGLYDKDKNLIGVGSLANPIKKTENREFLFKLRIDI